MKPHDYIQINYNNLLEGDSRRGSVSDGCYRADVSGDTPAKCSMEVSRKGNWLIFNCLSASCQCGKVSNKCVPISGKPVRRSKEERDRDRAVPNYVIPRGAVSALPRHCVRYLEENNVSSAYARSRGMCWDAERQRIIVPLHPDGQKGYVFRKIEARTNPQDDGTSSYIKRTGWIRHFPKITLPFYEGEGDTVYIVESILSAMALAERGLGAIASLGIIFDESKIRQVRALAREHKFKNIVLLPDPDVSFKMGNSVLRKLKRAGVGNVSILRLSNKPRYSVDELEKYMKDE